MTVIKGFVIVILSALAFALAGGLIGFTLGTTMPGYYRPYLAAGGSRGSTR